MTEKFVDDIKLEQQRVASLIVQLKNEIGQVTNSVAGKETQIQELTGKLDVLKQVEEFYTKGVVNTTAEAPPEQVAEYAQEQQQQPPQSVFTSEQPNDQS